MAQVGDIGITAEQIEKMAMSENEAHQSVARFEHLKDLTEDQIRFELLANAAVLRHLDQDPDVIDAARKIMVRKLLQRDLQETPEEAQQMDADVRAYYEKHQNSYLMPEKRRFAQIELPKTSAGRTQAQNLIDRMRRRPQLHDTFNAMAKRLSRDMTTRNQGGEEGFASFEEVVKRFGPDVATAVFTQEPDTIAKTLITHPVASAHGWHVIYVLARREALVRDFEDVQDSIRERLSGPLRTKKFETYINDLRQGIPVSFNPEPLKQLAARWQERIRREK